MNFFLIIISIIFLYNHIQKTNPIFEIEDSDINPISAPDYSDTLTDVAYAKFFVAYGAAFAVVETTGTNDAYATWNSTAKALLRAKEDIAVLRTAYTFPV